MKILTFSTLTDGLNLIEAGKTALENIEKARKRSEK